MRGLMTRYGEFVEFVMEQMAPFGRPRMRAMFGGFGVYRDDQMFAIVIEDRLYFKADQTSRAEFEEKGLRPFTYVARGKPVTMSYFEAPAEVFEDPQVMRSWADRAYEAALRAKKTRTSKKAKRPTRKKRDG